MKKSYKILSLVLVLVVLLGSFPLSALIQENMGSVDSSAADASLTDQQYETEDCFTISNNSEKELVAIMLTKEPIKTVYALNEALNTDGIEITATYSDNTTEIIPVANCTFTDLDSTTAGEKTITVDYKGKTTTFTVTVIAENPHGQCGDNAYWSLDKSTGTLSITGRGAMYDLVSSEEQPWYSYIDDITLVNIADGITAVGDLGFSGCKKLNAINIPNTVTSIGDASFYNCEGLSAIDIPNAVTSIGNAAFSECRSLTSITIPNGTIGSGAFFHCNNLTNVQILENVTQLQGNPFLECEKLSSIQVSAGNQSYLTDTQGILYNKDETEIICFPVGKEETSFSIPNGVKSIGDDAFAACNNLTSVNIPNSVVSIGSCAFSRCTNLTSITIPNGTIGWSAFSNCNNLTNVQILENVTQLQGNPFLECEKLSSIQVSAGNQSYLTDTQGILYSKDKTEIICFPVRKEETSFSIPNGVKSIGDDAFAACNNLTSVNIPNGVTDIGYGAFQNCKKITEIIIPESVRYVSSDAFLGCGATAVTINSAGATIDDRAFGYSDYDTQIGGFVVKGYLNSTAQQYATDNSFTFEPLGDKTYTYNIGAEKETDVIVTLTLSTGILSITGQGAMKDWEEWEVPWRKDGNNQIIQSVTIENGVQNIGNNAFSFCMSLISITIPNSVTNIGDSAFYYCEHLSSINIPNAVANIGYEAFSQCTNLTSITIPNGTIGWSAFSGCENLSSICILDGVTEIESSAFSDCENISSIQVSAGNQSYLTDTQGVLYDKDKTILLRCPIGNNTANFDIPNTVTKIADSSFQNCKNLVSVNIPNGVTDIGSGAFQDCKKLTEIIIPEGVGQISSDAFTGCSATDVTINSTGATIGERAFGYSDHDTKIEGFVVKGYLNSTAQQYATDNGFTFESLGDKTYTYNIGAENETDVIATLTLSTGILSITGQGAMKDWTQNDVPWYKDGNRHVIKTVTINGGITNISDYTFSWFTALNSIDIPNSVTEIGQGAFEGCSSLSSIALPNNLKEIKRGTFVACSKLKNINLPESIEKIALQAFWNSGLESIDIPANVTTIEDMAFASCGELLSATINNSGTTIGEKALGYVGDSKVESFTIKGYGGSTAQKYATDNGFTFVEIEGKTLSSISITKQPTKNVYEIGETLNTDGIEITATYSDNTTEIIPVANCTFTNLDSTTAGEKTITVTYLDKSTTFKVMVKDDNQCGDNAYWSFDENTGTLRITGSGDMYDLTSLYEQPWKSHANSVKAINISDEITSIGDWCFCELRFLKNINFSENSKLKTIGKDAFFNDVSLKSVNVPNSVISIKNEAFCGCHALEMLSFESSSKLQTIGDWAFAANGIGDYPKLTAVTIPNSVISIGEFAFRGCDDIVNIIFEENSHLETIGNEAFAGNCFATHKPKIAQVTLPASVTSIATNAFDYCPSLTAINIDESNQTYCNCENDGIVYTKDKETLVICPAGKASVTVPENVVTIGANAFYSCILLENISFSENSHLETIGEGAFAGNGGLYPKFTTITIPSGVTTIDKRAFAWCQALKSVTFKKNSNIKTIGEWAFSSCTSMEYVIFEVDFKNQSIEEPTFTANSLEECKSLDVTADTDEDAIIEDKAFYSCKNLKGITVPDSIASIGTLALGYYEVNQLPVKMDNFTIKGTKGTAAETYATQNGFTFVEVGGGDTEIKIKPGSSYVINNTNGYVSHISEKTSKADFLNNFSNSNIDVYGANGEALSDSDNVGTGCVVKATSNGNAISTATVVVTGDVDGNGEIDIFDVFGILDHINNKTVLTGAKEKATLVDSEDEASIFDVFAVLDYINGKRTIEPRAV